MNTLKSTFRLIAGLSLFLNGFIISAQSVITPKLQWANGITGKGNCRAGGSGPYTEKGEKGNLVTVGTYSGTLDFDPSIGKQDLSTPMQDIYIWKYDNNGKNLWVKTINYYETSPTGFPVLGATSLSVDQENGDIYITGIFGDTTIDFDPGIGIAKMIPGNILFDLYWPSLFILKLNAAGDFQWVKQLDIYNGGVIQASAITQHVKDEHKLLYFTGSASPIMDYNIGENILYDFDPGLDTAYIRFTDPNAPIGFILCLNDKGEFVWVKTIGEKGNGDDLVNFIPATIAVNETSIFVAGLITGTADVNPAPAVYNISGQGDMFLLKYTINGELEWARQSEMGKTVYEGSERLSWGFVSSTELDAKGNIYLSVDINGPANFNRMMPYGGLATLINISYYPYFSNSTATALMRYNNNGDFAWIRQIGGGDTVNRTVGSRLSLAKDGILYLSGIYNNSVDVDPGEDSFLLKGSSGYIAQYDTTGNFMWGGKIPKGTFNAESFAQTTSLKSEEGGVVYLAGYWLGGAMDFDPGSGGFILTPADSAVSSAFVAKLKIAAIDTTTIDTLTSIPNLLLSLDVKVYPNPTVGMLGIESSRSLNNAVLSINNIAGQVVFRKTELTGNKFLFDLSVLAAGTYIFELREGNQRRTYKLAKL